MKKQPTKRKNIRKRIIALVDSDSETENSDACFTRKKLISREPTTSTSQSTQRKNKQTQRTQSKTRRTQQIVHLTSSDDNDDDKIDNLQTQKKKIDNKKIAKNHINQSQLKLKSRINELQRDNSNSASEREFSKYKITESFVPLQRIVDLDKDYTVSPHSSPHEQKQKLSHSSAFSFKNYTHNFCNEMKQVAKKILNDIEHIEKTYHYRDNLTVADTTRVMVNCKNVIRDVGKLSTEHEKKVVEHYDKWCKKTKIKNIFITNSGSNTVDTPTRWEKPKKDNVHIESSGSEQPEPSIIPPELTKKTGNITNGRVPSPELSDIDAEIFSDDESNNPQLTKTPDQSQSLNEEKSKNDKNKSTDVDKEKLPVSPQKKLSGYVSEKHSDNSFENNEKSNTNENTKRNETSDQSDEDVATIITQSLTPNSVDMFDDDESITEIHEMNNKSSGLNINTTPKSLKSSKKSKKNLSQENVFLQDTSSSSEEENKEKRAKLSLLRSSSESEKIEDNKEEENALDTSMESDALVSPAPSPIPKSPDDEEQTSKKNEHLDLSDSDEDKNNEEQIKTNHVQNSKNSQINSSDLEQTKVQVAAVTDKSSKNCEIEPEISLDVSENTEKLSTVVENNNLNLSDNDIEKIKETTAKKKLLETSSDSDHNGENHLQSTHLTDADEDKSDIIDTSLDKSLSSSSPEPGEIIEIPTISTVSVTKTSEDEKRSNNINKQIEGILEDLIEDRARKALLDTSSDSDGANKSTPHSNDENNKKSKANDDKEDTESTSTNSTPHSSKLKRTKFRKQNNKYWKRDSKLRMKCQVVLKQLSRKILFQHARALKKSKEFLENKEVIRYTDIRS